MHDINTYIHSEIVTDRYRNASCAHNYVDMSIAVRIAYRSKKYPSCVTVGDNFIACT